MRWSRVPTSIVSSACCPTSRPLPRQRSRYDQPASRLARGVDVGGRLGIAAVAVGLAKAALDDARAYANERTTFGRKLIDHRGLEDQRRITLILDSPGIAFLASRRGVEAGGAPIQIGIRCGRRPPGDMQWDPRFEVGQIGPADRVAAIEADLQVAPEHDCVGQVFVALHGGLDGQNLDGARLTQTPTTKRTMATRFRLLVFSI
jgi:hypothetical protein